MAFALLLTLVSVCYAAKLPIVDLGYERHQAISFNVWYRPRILGVE